MQWICICPFIKWNLENTAGDGIMLLYFDGFNLNNIKVEKEFLCNSVDDELKQQLNENTNKGSSFVTYWLELTHTRKLVWKR